MYLLALHRIVKGLGMEKHDIKNILEIAKYNQLELLQWKVQYLTNEVKMLEFQKEKATSDILKLNRAINQLQSFLPLPQNREEMNQGTGWYDNTDNLYPRYTEPDSGSYSIQLSYRDYWPW